jgi:hypothetical protein
MQLILILLKHDTAKLMRCVFFFKGQHLRFHYHGQSRMSNVWFSKTFVYCTYWVVMVESVGSGYMADGQGYKETPQYSPDLSSRSQRPIWNPPWIGWMAITLSVMYGTKSAQSFKKSVKIQKQVWLSNLGVKVVGIFTSVFQLIPQNVRTLLSFYSKFPTKRWGHLEEQRRSYEGVPTNCQLNITAIASSTNSISLQSNPLTLFKFAFKFGCQQ